MPRAAALRVAANVPRATNRPKHVDNAEQKPVPVTAAPGAPGVAAPEKVAAPPVIRIVPHVVHVVLRVAHAHLNAPGVAGEHAQIPVCAVLEKCRLIPVVTAAHGHARAQINAPGIIGAAVVDRESAPRAKSETNHAATAEVGLEPAQTNVLGQHGHPAKTRASVLRAPKIVRPAATAG